MFVIHATRSARRATRHARLILACAYATRRALLVVRARQGGLNPANARLGCARTNRRGQGREVVRIAARAAVDDLLGAELRELELLSGRALQ